MITKHDVEQAYQIIQHHLKPSPVIYSPKLSRLCNCELFLKLENRQMTGSFKERGALNKLHHLSKVERAGGVIAASAGNHAQGLAYNATKLGIKSKVVMPQGTPLTKLVATQEFGAEVILHGDVYDDAYQLATQIADDEGLTFVHAFDDPFIIAGQGTIGVELLTDPTCEGMETVVCPVGGGGLISGIATYLKAEQSTIEVIGVEASACPSMAQAWRNEKPTTIKYGASLADGIAVKQVGQLTYQVARQTVDALIAVAEDEIARAVLTLLEVEKLVVEGSGAVPLAAIITNPERFANKKVVLIISGGNIDVNLLDKIITNGLTLSGRIVELVVHLLDKPGYLVDVLEIIRELQANVLDISHHRYNPNIPFGYVDVAITLETKGISHISKIKETLQQKGYHLQP